MNAATHDVAPVSALADVLALWDAAAQDLVSQALCEGEPLASAYRYKRSILDELRR